MPKIRFILSKQPDPALQEAAIIKRLKEFHSRLQDKRQISDGIPQEERAAHNELWRYPQNELPKALEIRIRRWAQKIHRNHLKDVEPTRLSREDRAMLEGCRDGADVFDLRSAHHIDEIAAALHAEFPWIAEATTLVWRSLHHNLKEGMPGARFGPILLDGPPGIGKSAWARRLAQLQGTPDMIVDATGENASFGLVGSQRGWSNAGPGRLVSLMLMRQVANPLVIIDEIEKSGSVMSDKGRSFSLPNALLPLLEEMTACRWTCPYFQNQFDMSFINWVFTSNSLRGLPEPLLSRIRVVSVPSPTQEQINELVLREAERRQLSPLITAAITTALAEAFEAGHQINIRTVKRMLELGSDQQGRPTIH
ncbi:AAA family ATPase [Rhodovulum sulfidophilum]|uniref:AAA family ATPase n=1 Tax=Rhodovulum sulfidophilum TaxID=35806 RepID=UPI00138A538C|nr:AAA family ATPase [Rhodovulum sulfidophilum]NDK36712.1 AAA family ATPase [Rhodovulum sulfidophilum]